jgi:hypothetical protein
MYFWVFLLFCLTKFGTPCFFLPVFHIYIYTCIFGSKISSGESFSIPSLILAEKFVDAIRIRRKIVSCRRKLLFCSLIVVDMLVLLQSFHFVCGAVDQLQLEIGLQKLNSFF